MKNIYKLKLFLMAFLILSVGLITACDEDEDATNNGQVELLSFGPTGVKHGDKIKFIGQNLNRVEAIVLQGVTVPKAEFTFQSSDLIELIVPEAAEKGKVVLKVEGGQEITSKSELSFEVPVIISSVTGTAKPGSNITIKGEYLNWIDSVQFGSLKTSVKTFVSRSLNEVVLTVPMEAKTGKLMIYTGGTEPMSIETEDELSLILPTFTSMSPLTLKHGENITITGTNLDLVKQVKFTGVGSALVSSFVSRSETQLVVTVPDNASTGALSLIAFSLEEVPATQSVTIILPSITSLSPNPVDHGANLTITGTNLDLVKTVVFKSDKSVADFASQSSSKIVVKVPAGAEKGTLTLVTHRNYTVQTQLMLEFNGDLPPLAALPYALFDDAIRSGWGDWGWGGPSVWNSTEKVREGTVAAKKTYDGSNDGIRVHSGTPLSMAGYTKITFSVFGGAGTNGKIMKLVINEQWSSPYQFPIVEGEWTTYTLNLSEIGSPATINDVVFQSAAWAGVVHYDHIGFR